MNVNKKQTKRSKSIRLAFQGFIEGCVAWVRKLNPWMIGGIAVVVLMVIFGMLFIVTTRGNIDVEYVSNQTSQTVDQPIRLKFSKQLGVVKPEIKPEVHGVWREKRQLLGVYEIEFMPDKPLAADTNYTVTFPVVRRSLFGKAIINDISFRTQKAPHIDKTSLDGKDVIAMDQVLTVHLNSRAGKLRDLELKTEPSLKLRRESTDDQTFSWEYDGLLTPDTQYTLIVYDKTQKEELKRITTKSAPLPMISSPIKEYSVTPSDELKLVFQESIDVKNRPDITVDVAGNGSWRNDTEYIFKPDKLEPGRTYTYTIPKGLRTVRGGILTEAIKKAFTTNGRVRSVTVSPWRVMVDQAVQDVRLTFNQAVNHQSAQDRLRVSSGTVQNISWQGNTMIIRLVNMGFQRQVQVWIEPGVQPIFGLPSIERIATSFTTSPRIIKLNVPFYRQMYAQSCEAASLRMALAYRGVHDSDWNILQRFGYFPRPRDKEKNEWDDPNLQFVGDVNGNQGAGTGWGVYAGPVARAASQYGRSTSLAYGANANFVAQQIYNGNPVIAWGVWRIGAKIDSWKTPLGQIISGPMPMHVRLIVGVRGELNDPLGFYVNDPILGQLYWTKTQFIAMTSGAGPAAQLLAIY